MRKRAIQEILNSFPDDADVDVDALIEKIDVLERIEEAEQQFAAGMEIPHEEMEKEFKEWLK